MALLALQISEAEVDEAVMKNRISKLDAAVVREQVRRQTREDLER